MYTSNRNRNTVIVLLFILAILALLLHQSGQLQPLEDIAFGWIQPILRATLGLTESAQNVTDTVTDINTLRNQVKQLQAQVDQSAINQSRAIELEKENSILRTQLGYKQANPDFDLVGAAILERNPDMARIIGQDPTNLVRYIIVDQGSAEGVKVGMPVVTPQGLVGRVTSAGTHSSKVLLITDPSSSVNAVVQSTRATGVVQGETGNIGSNNLIIRYVPQGEAIKTGDVILTSGMGGSFPKRLVIGQVTQVQKRDIDLFQEATIQPSVDFVRLEFVLILKKFTPSDITQEPTPTPSPTPKPTVTPTPKP